MSKEDEKKKKRKERQSIIEKELFAMLQVSLKECLDKALDEVLKDFNK